MVVAPSMAPSATNDENECGEGYLPVADNPTEIKRIKLFIRPPTPPTIEQVCGTKAIRNKLNTKAIPYYDKLTIRRKARLDLIRDQIPRLEGSVPPTALPPWFEMDMNVKIPYVKAPEKYFYYARGKLGEPLHRCHPFYTVHDQRNQVRVVTTPYNALHDPSVRTYLFQPSVKSFLNQQGLINERSEVFCSQREFNQFRGYLNTLFNDEVGQAVRRRDSDWKYQRQQMLNIQSYFSRTGCHGHQAFLNSRRVRAKAIQREARKNRMQKHNDRERRIEIQMMHFREQKAQENLIRVILGYQRDQRTAERLCRLRCQRMMVQQELLQSLLDLEVQAETRRKNNIILAAKTAELTKINWVDDKLEFGKAKMEHNRQLEEALRLENEANAIKRQRRVEYGRAMMPIDIEIAKDDMRKTWEIVRKFARRWLDKVRRRLNAPKDLLHESVWLGNSKGVLDDTLKDLKELSGYDGVFERWDILIRGGHHSMQKEACDETLTGACAADTGKHATVGSDHGDREKQEKREKRKKYMEQHQKKPEIPLEKCDSEKEIPKKLKKHKAKDKKTEGMDSKQVKRAKNRQEVAKHPIVQAEQELFILPPCQPEPAPTCLTGPPAITLSSDEGLTLLISSSSQPVPEQTYLTGPPGPTYLPPEPTYVPSGPTYLPPGPTYLQPGPTYLPPGPPEQPCLTGPPGSTSSLDQGSTSSLPPDPRLMQPSLCKVTEDAPPSEQSSLVLGDKLPDNRPAAQQSTACLPARKTSSEDFSWVDKIIRNQQTVLQNEKDIVGQGDEDAIEGLIDKRNLSRVASLIAEKALCNQFRGLNDQLDDLCSDDQSHKNLPSAKPRPSDYSFVDQIINDKRDALQKEQKDICKEDPIACESASHGRVAPRPSDYSFVDQVINEQRDALQKEQEAICKEDPIVCQSVSNSRVPPRPSDYSFVDQVINEQRDALQKEQEAICKEDPIACKSISDAQVPPPSDGPRPTLIASELVDQVIKEKKESLERSMNQPNLAAVSEPALPLASSSSSGYLDPNEAGISMIRSEVRLQLNALRGELDYLKSQLAFQGILKPDDDHPSPPPR